MPRKTNGIIPSLIRSEREAAGLNRSQLAKKLKTRYQRVYEWETGKKQPRDLDRIIRVCRRSGKNRLDHR